MEFFWKKYGNGSAHLYTDGVRDCSVGVRQPDKEAEIVVSVSKFGTPFGKVCQFCMDKWQRYHCIKSPSTIRESESKPQAPAPEQATQCSARARGAEARRANRILFLARDIKSLQRRLLMREKELDLLLDAGDTVLQPVAKE